MLHPNFTAGRGRSTLHRTRRLVAVLAARDVSKTAAGVVPWGCTLPRARGALASAVRLFHPPASARPTMDDLLLPTLASDALAIDDDEFDFEDDFDDDDLDEDDLDFDEEGDFDDLDDEDYDFDEEGDFDEDDEEYDDFDDLSDDLDFDDDF